MIVSSPGNAVRFRGSLRRAAFGVAVAFAMLAPRVAKAELACDAGNMCPDDDHDGVAACGCPWSGVPCDCDDADPTVFPGAPESCDSAKDNNCSGVASDPCPANEGCLAGMCVPKCIPLDDFGCAGGSSFARAPDSSICLCEPKDCTIFGCPAGRTCDEAKTCVPNCSPDVRCPRGQVCRGFGCVDPCEEMTCPDGAVCDEGRCVPSCACSLGSSCPPGETCDLAAPVPSCIDPACVGIACAAGMHCELGRCIDDCAGVVCPPMRVCRKVSVNGGPSKARCVDLCSPNPCEPDETCDRRTGRCTPLPRTEGGLEAPTSTDVERLEVAGAGWLCTSAGLGRASAITALTGAGAVLLFGLRRRRSRRSRRR